MAPLMCASVSDIYGSEFGLSSEQIVQKTLKNNNECAEKNNKYQQHLLHNEIAGKADFKQVRSPETFGNLNGDNTNIPPNTSQSNNDNLRNTNFAPNPATSSYNNSKFAKRVAWSDKNNTWPSNQGFSMFNRFQSLMGEREYLNDSDCVQHLVTLVKELLLMVKIIMFILILLFLIKILEKK